MSSADRFGIRLQKDCRQSHVGLLPDTYCQTLTARHKFIRGTHPDQFILDVKGLDLVENSFPFKGDGLSCSHQGAHLLFNRPASDYAVDIYAPADGYMSQKETM